MTKPLRAHCGYWGGGGTTEEMSLEVFLAKQAEAVPMALDDMLVFVLVLHMAQRSS